VKALVLFDNLLAGRNRVPGEHEEAVFHGADVVVFRQGETDAAKTVVVCALAQERDRVLGRNGVFDGGFQALVQIPEAFLILDEAGFPHATVVLSLAASR
jgi:hypothetical protein